MRKYILSRSWPTPLKIIMGIYDELNDITGTKKNAPHKSTLTNSHREHGDGKTSTIANK
jgi:hypothetical protein